MSNTIWKFEMAIKGRQIIDMPAGAKILDLQIQCGRLALWSLVNPGMMPVPRSFDIYGTGHETPEDPGKYIATIQSDAGVLVWHVFDTSTY